MKGKRLAGKRGGLIAAMCGAALMVAAQQAAAETCKETNVASAEFGETFECTPFTGGLGKGADGRVGTIIGGAAGGGGGTSEPETCKFPGEVGTPPNCACPPDTEFFGYRGCIAHCCTGSHQGGGSITYCGAHAQAKELASNARFNGEPPDRVECKVK